MTVRHRILLTLAAFLLLWGALVGGALLGQSQQREHVQTSRHLVEALEGARRMQGALNATLRPLHRFADTQRQDLRGHFRERAAAFEDAVAGLRARKGLGAAVDGELATLHGLAQDIRATGLAVFQSTDSESARSLVAVTRSFVHLARGKAERVADLVRLGAVERLAEARGGVRQGGLGLLVGGGVGALLAATLVLWALGGVRRRLVSQGRGLEEAAEALELVSASSDAGAESQPAVGQRVRALRTEARRGAGELVSLLEGLEAAPDGPARPGENLAGARGALETVAAEARSLSEAPTHDGAAGIQDEAGRLRSLAETAQAALQEAEPRTGYDPVALRGHAKRAGQALAAVAREAQGLEQHLSQSGPAQETPMPETAARLREIAAELRREA